MFSDDDEEVIEEEDEDAAMEEDEDMEDEATAAAAAMAKTIQQQGQAKAAGAANDDDDDDLAVYNLDDYDKEESKSTAAGAFSNIKGLSYYGDNNDDPYITLESVSPASTRSGPPITVR